MTDHYCAQAWRNTRNVENIEEVTVTVTTVRVLMSQLEIWLQSILYSHVVFSICKHGAVQCVKQERSPLDWLMLAKSQTNSDWPGQPLQHTPKMIAGVGGFKRACSAHTHRDASWTTFIAGRHFGHNSNTNMDLKVIIRRHSNLLLCGVIVYLLSGKHNTFLTNVSRLRNRLTEVTLGQRCFC